MVTVSAKTGLRIDKILPQVEKVYEEYSRKIPTATLNECFERAIQKNPMSSYRGKFMKLFYATQVKKQPRLFFHLRGIKQFHEFTPVTRHGVFLNSTFKTLI